MAASSFARVWPANDAPLGLLIVTNLFHPDRAGGAAIYSDFAYEMAARGHRVTVRCSYPYFPEWEDKSGRNGTRVWRYVDQGVHVERYGTWYPTGGIRRLADRIAFEASQLASMTRSLPRRSFDVALTFATHPGTTAFASMFSTLTGVPLVVNVQDLASDAAEATGLASDRTSRVLARTERTMLGRAAAITALSDGMASRLRTLVPHRPVTVLPNWLHESLEAEVTKRAGIRTWVPEGRLRLLYAGNIGTKQDLLGCCKRLAATSVPFTMDIHAAGRGADEVAAWIERDGDQRFRVGPFLTEGGFIDALRACDLFVVCETAGSGDSYVPSKLLPAMASGTPVLVVSDPKSSLGTEVRAHPVGLALTWAPTDDWARELTKVLDDPSSLGYWSDGALGRAGDFDRLELIDNLEALLLEVSARRVRGAPSSSHGAPTARVDRRMPSAAAR